MGLKRLECDIDHWPPSVIKFKNEWSYTSVPPCAFIVWTGVTLYFSTLPLNSVEYFIIHTKKHQNNTVEYEL
jgi:hypothetical protein